MIVDELIDLLDASLGPVGASADLGEEARDPPLDVLRYYRRPGRISSLPIVGRSLGVVAVVRQPPDVDSADDDPKLLLRVCRAADRRYPAWGRPGGLVLGLTAVVVTPEPIGPGEEARIAGSLSGRRPRSRAFPLGLVRLNLGQEAMAFSLVSGPPGAFPESEAVVDALTPHFRRFVPLISF